MEEREGCGKSVCGLQKTVLKIGGESTSVAKEVR